jgi:hypothetical protein
LDVRVIFWRNDKFFSTFHQFLGRSSDIFTLAKKTNPKLFGENLRVEFRWDQSPKPEHCHHEKSWFIDCGQVIGPIVGPEF